MNEMGFPASNSPFVMQIGESSNAQPFLPVVVNEVQ